MQDNQMSLEKVSDFRHRLLEYMKEKNLRQRDIVKLTGMNKSTLNNYLSGYRNDPSIERKEKIAKSLGVSLGWLDGYDCSKMPELITNNDNYYDPSKKITKVDEVLGYGKLRHIFEKLKYLDVHDLDKVIAFIDMITDK